MGVEATKSLSPSEVLSFDGVTGDYWITTTDFLTDSERVLLPYFGLICQTDVNGMLEVEFSVDNINWSDFPVAGFTIIANVNEVHGAYKGSRYIRLRFTSSVAPTYFRLLFDYSPVAVTLTAPLNQSVSKDQDASVVRSVVTGFDAVDGTSHPAEVTKTGELAIYNPRAVVTQAGSQFFESIRDDIDVSYDIDATDNEINSRIEAVFVDNGGGFSRDLTEGRGVFSTDATPGAITYYQSRKRTVYEPGHEIISEQTIKIDTTNVIGDATVEWGLARDDGAGGIDHAIGMRLTANGLYVFRRKNGVDEHLVLQDDWNRDTLQGGDDSRYIVNGSPTSLQVDKNSLWRQVFEWLGVAPPTWKVMLPVGGVQAFHIEETPGQIEGTTLPTPRLHVFVRIKNDLSGS
jgi:hypothetical protein